jgi:hypothetical protein
VGNACWLILKRALFIILANKFAEEFLRFNVIAFAQMEERDVE